MNDLTSNVIVLRSVYGKVNMIYKLNPARDPRTGRFPDHIKPVNSMGDLLISDADRNSGKIFIAENAVFTIEDGKTYDLNDEYQLAEWNAIKYAPVIAQSREERDSKGNLKIDGDKRRYGIAELYVVNPGEATARKTTKKKLVHDACTYIFDDPKGASGRSTMAKLLGRHMTTAPDADITDYLLSIAEKDPEKIINLYRGDDINLRLLFIDAKDKKVIYVKNKVYLYSENQIVLGATDDAVISWMKNPRNSRVLELLKRDTYPEMYTEQEPDYEKKLKDAEPKKYDSKTGK